MFQKQLDPLRCFKLSYCNFSFRIIKSFHISAYLFHTWAQALKLHMQTHSHTWNFPTFLFSMKLCANGPFTPVKLILLLRKVRFYGWSFDINLFKNLWSGALWAVMRDAQSVEYNSTTILKKKFTRDHLAMQNDFSNDFSMYPKVIPLVFYLKWFAYD